MSRKIIGVTVGTQLPKPNFKQTDPTKGDYIKNKPDFDGLKSRVTGVEEALEGKQPVGDYALKSEIPSIAGLATEDYVDEKIANHSALPEGASAHQMLVTDADGNAKWEDRIAYEEQTIATILPENTPTFNEDSGFLITEPLQHELVVGKSYTVIWNGVEYECEFEEYTLTSEEIGTMIARYFGDMSPMIGEDPKGVYPFCIVTSMSIGGMNQMPAGVYGACMPLDESTEITLSIKGEAFIVRKIPDKYLPEKTHWITEADIEIMPEQTFNNLSNSIVPVNAILTHDFVAGCQYTVTWNGIDYVCVAQEPTEFATVMLGNASALGGTSSADPFLFAVLTVEAMQQVGGSYLISAFDGSTSATMKIIEPAGTVHKIDKKFLPDITAEDISAVPETRTINGKALNTNVVLTTSDINAVPTSRTINGKALNSNITLTASDVDALPATTQIPSIDGLATETYVDTKVSNLVNSAPETLDTLGELAEALKNNQSVIDTLNSAITNKVDKNSLGALAAKDTISKPDLATDIQTSLGKADTALQSYTETDPTVPVWAKAATKPTYTADEVGAEPKGAVAALNIANGTGDGSIKMDSAAEASGRYSFAAGADYRNFVKISGEANTTTYYVDSLSKTKIGSILSKDTIEATVVEIDRENLTITLSQTLSAEEAITETYVQFKSNVIASGSYSHAEGLATTASGESSHAEGELSIASGRASHAEGLDTIASRAYDHAEGSRTEASGQASHAEGQGTIAGALASHAEGLKTKAFGQYSHAEGKYTIASDESSHVQGRYNVHAIGYAHIVGNGTAENARSNAHTIDWDGNAWYQGNVYVGGTDQNTNSEKLMTQSEVMALIASILPTPTAADAGKILRVNAEGKYELVALPNAEEASF